MARPSPSCAHDDDRLHFSPASPPSSNSAEKKESTGRRLSQLCPPCATPSSNSSLDYRRSDARIVENGFATSGGLSKSAKVVPPAALVLDRKKLAAFSAAAGRFLQFPIGDRRCNRTRASVGNAGGNARPSLTNATLAASRLLHRRSPTAPCSKGHWPPSRSSKKVESEVQASPGTRVSNICQGTRLGSSANTGCQERRNTISPTCRRTPTCAFGHRAPDDDRVPQKRPPPVRGPRATGAAGLRRRDGQPALKGPFACSASMNSVALKVPSGAPPTP